MIIQIMVQMDGGILILPFISKCLSFVFTKINKLIFGPAASLGARNISDSKVINSNIKLVVISLSLVLMIFITSLSLEAAFANVRDVFKVDIQVYGMGKKENEYLKLKKVDGIESLNFMYGFFQEFDINGKRINFGLQGLKDEDFGVKNIEGKIKDLKAGEVMIDEFYGMKNDLKIGDQLEIKSDNLKTQDLKVKIVGTVDSSTLTTDRNIIVFSQTQFKEDITDIPNSILVETSMNLDQMKKTLYRELSGEDIIVETVDELLEGQEQMVGGILSIVWIFLILSIFLSAIGLINNQVIGFIQRKREYAVLNSIAMSGKNIKDYGGKLDDILEIVGLSEKRREIPSRLSGGQQQRVAIARAVIINPSIILADEPVGNLDSKSSKRIMELFKDINTRYGITIIQVTHDESMALYGNRLIRIHDGIIVEDKNIEEMGCE